MTKKEVAKLNGFMSVGQLIKELSKYDNDTPVLTPGFDEGGYDFAFVEAVEDFRFTQVSSCNCMADRVSDIPQSCEGDDERESIKCVLINFC